MLLRAHSQFISQSTFIFLFFKLPHGASIFFDTVIPHPPLGAEAVSSGSLRSFLSCGQLALEMGGLEASSARHRMPLDHRNAEENESLFRSHSCGLLCQSAGSLAIIHFYSSSWWCLCLLSDDVHSCRWYIRWSWGLHSVSLATFFWGLVCWHFTMIYGGLYFFYLFCKELVIECIMEWFVLRGSFPHNLFKYGLSMLSAGIAYICVKAPVVFCVWDLLRCISHLLVHAWKCFPEYPPLTHVSLELCQAYHHVHSLLENSCMVLPRLSLLLLEFPIHLGYL